MADMLKEYEIERAMCRWQITGLNPYIENGINRILQKNVIQNTVWCLVCERGNVHCSNQTCIPSYQKRQNKIKRTDILTAPILIKNYNR